MGVTSRGEPRQRVKKEQEEKEGEQTFIDSYSDMVITSFELEEDVSNSARC